MEFVLIDLYNSKIENTEFKVLVLYENKAHVTTKVYFKSDDKTNAKLQDFYNKNCYGVVSNFVKYEMKSNGKISIKISI